MPFTEVGGARLYYELTGVEDGPIVLQFGGSLFGRQNFDPVNPAFRSRYRLLSYDASGYGRSERPIEDYSIEVWADEAASLLDALGIERALVHGTSMGGMIAIAFAAMHPERTIAACADCAMARPDASRRILFRHWRRAAESMPIDDVAELIATQAVSAEFLEQAPSIVDDTRRVVMKNSPYTVRQACLAMETMDLESLALSIRRPILFTNGTADVMTPPRLAPSGFSAAQIAAALPEYARLHEFAEIGHASLLECPDEAFRVVSEFFDDVLSREAELVGGRP